MIQKALTDLAKQIFWLITITLVLALPIMAIVNPTIDQQLEMNEMLSGTGWYAMAALIGYTLIIVGVIVFWIFPTLIRLGEAIVKSRKEAREEMFP
jgi:uncharacterized membrane protein YciS (DUF1049 family)